MKTELNFRLDPDLSLKAKAILYHALELSPGSKFSVQELISTCLDEKCSVRSGIKELELGGYLYREKRKTKLGKLYKWLYLFSETPLNKKQFQKLKEEQNED